METFVLILVITAGGNGVTSQTVDFGGREACEAAGSAAVAALADTYRNSVYYVCAQKNGVSQ